MVPGGFSAHATEVEQEGLRFPPVKLYKKGELDQEILSINYVVETVNRTVYLIGIGQNKAELDRVKQHAAQVKFVRNVISHVRVKK